MNENEYFIKRIIFQQVEPIGNLDNYWFVDPETGDCIMKMTHIFKHKSYIDDLCHIQYMLNNILSHKRFYERTIKYIPVDLKHITFKDEIQEIDNRNHVIDEDDVDKFDWNCPVSYDNDEMSLITRDFGLFIKRINEDGISNFIHIRNSHVEPVKVLEPRHPKNIHGKDKYTFYPRIKNTDVCKWYIENINM